MKKITKSIITSSLLAVAFGALSVGSTFALFTSQAETTINVESGEVRVGQTLAIQSVSELGDVAVQGIEGVFTNSIGGKTYIDSENPSALHLEKWAPGDKAVLKVTNNNYSNVIIKTRFNETHTSTSNPDLYDALTINYVAKDANDNDIGYKFMDWSIVEPTVTKISDVYVTIEFPDGDNGQILFDDDNHDNTKQNLNCTIIFTQQAVQGNAVTNSLLEQLNTALDTAAATQGRNKTMYDALQDVSTIKTEAQLKAIGYVWGSADDYFHYAEEGTTNAYFKIYDEMPETQTNSIYASSTWSVAIVNLEGVGFDAGNSSGITAINYVGTGVANEVTIRTNSLLTSLTVNAPSDIVNHYDSLGSVNVISSDTSSYHENGTVSFLEVAGGHIVLEETSAVSAVHFTATNNEFKNSDDKTISIDLSKVNEDNMPSFSRDPVSIQDDGTYVAEVTTTKTEYVWLFGNGIKEQMVTTEQEGSIAIEGTLKTGITAGAEDGSVAEQIANPAKRNSEGALIDENDQEIDVSSVDWTNSDALDNVTEIVYEELKTKQEAINENVSTLIMNMSELYDYVTGEVVNGIIGTDIEVTQIMELGGDKILNLNGYTLNVNLSSGRPFVFSNGQSMTVNANNGKMLIINNNTNGLFRIQSAYSELVLNGGTYEGYTPGASAIIWVGNLNNILTCGVNIELNNVTANCIGQFVRDSSLSVLYSSYQGISSYRDRGVPVNKLSVKGGNYTFNNAGINVSGSISGFVLQSMESVFENVTATSAIGSIMEIDNGVAVFKNNNFLVQNSNNIQGWNATTIGVAYQATITIESGTYSGYYGISVFTSGGHIIMNGGTVIGSSHAFDLYDDDNRSTNNQVTTLDIYGGTINGDIFKRGTEAIVTDHR